MSQLLIFLIGYIVGGVTVFFVLANLIMDRDEKNELED